jgi:hypothetical protein
MTEATSKILIIYHKPVFHIMSQLSKKIEEYHLHMLSVDHTTIGYFFDCSQK